MKLKSFHFMLAKCISIPENQTKNNKEEVKNKESNGILNQLSGKVQKRKLKDEGIPGWM